MLDSFRCRFQSEVEKIGVAKIATALGISRGTVYNWINNGNAPLDKLVALGNLGADINYIISGERQEIQPDEAALLDNYRHSPPEAQAAIKATSAAFAQSSTTMKKGKAA